MYKLFVVFTDCFAYKLFQSMQSLITSKFNNYNRHTSQGHVKKNDIRIYSFIEIFAGIVRTTHSKWQIFLSRISIFYIVIMIIILSSSITVFRSEEKCCQALLGINISTIENLWVTYAVTGKVSLTFGLTTRPIILTPKKIVESVICHHNRGGNTAPLFIS